MTKSLQSPPAASADGRDRFWAFYNHQPALFKGVFSKEELHGFQ